jgi:hypothetical protein
MEIEVFNTSQLASVLGCDEVTIERRTLAGDLPGLKFGRSWVFPAGATIQLLNELALEQAAKRRADRAASAAPLAVALRAPQQRGRRHSPVALPELPQP